MLASVSRLDGPSGPLAHPGIEVNHGHWGSALRVCIGEDMRGKDGPVWRDVAADPVPMNYERFVEAVRTGVPAEPSFRHAAKLQKILDLALVADLNDRRELKL